MSNPPPSPSARRIVVTLIILQILQLVSLVPWLLLAGFSVMAFDAPGSAEKWQPWAFVLTIWSYPIWLILAGVTAWIFFAVAFRRTALAIGIVFTLPALAMAALFGVGIVTSLFG